MGGLREVAASFVVPGPSGVAVRTRLKQLTPADEKVLALVGTHLGTWEWGPRDPTGWVSIGNPPSGAAGGYGWFDLAGLLVAPYLLAAAAKLSRRTAPETVDAG